MLHQYKRDPIVTMLIVLFWVLPPLAVAAGLYVTRRLQRPKMLLLVYYLFMFFYLLLLFLVALASLNADKIFEFVKGLLREATFWASTLAEVCLCNVVISDLLYMTVF